MKIEKLENDGREWYQITGFDNGTQLELDGIYGFTDDNVILNENGCPLTDGDWETIAVRNAIG